MLNMYLTQYPKCMSCRALLFKNSDFLADGLEICIFTRSLCDYLCIIILYTKVRKPILENGRGIKINSVINIIE